MNQIIAIAPMLKYTDRHFRFLARLLSKRVFLYTEMVTTGAVLYGECERFLTYHACEHPIVLQLGGSDPKALTKCAKTAADYGYDEVNLNIGCPSERVQSGEFGACLMKQPARVAMCLDAMREAVDIPITVKTRLGVDLNDSYTFLQDFVDAIRAAGCQTVILHARKVWLKGLSPRENRMIPPLNYDRVYQVKRDFPDLKIIINGGITDLAQAKMHLQQVDGVMIGRAAYDNPRMLCDIDHGFYQDEKQAIDWLAVLTQYAHYMQGELANGVSIATLIRHLLPLFHGLPNAKQWRRFLSERRYESIEDIMIFFKHLFPQFC